MPTTEGSVSFYLLSTTCTWSLTFTFATRHNNTFDWSHPISKSQVTVAVDIPAMSNIDSGYLKKFLFETMSSICLMFSVQLLPNSCKKKVELFWSIIDGDRVLPLIGQRLVFKLVIRGKKMS